MWLKAKIESLISPTSIAGVEMIFNNGEETVFHLCLLKKEKGKIISLLQEENISSLSELAKKIPAGTPLCLVMNGKGIMHRKVNKAEAGTDASLLQKVIPGAKLEDFYLQKVKSTGNDVFVSIVRKNQADEAIENFKKEKLEVISVSLGPFSITSLLPFMQLKSDYTQLKFMQNNLVIQSGVVESYSTSEIAEQHSGVTIGGESVKSHFINAFSAAFSGLLGNFSIAAEIDEVQNARQELNEKKKFQAAGMASLVFFLVILMGNYFFFDHYWKKKQELELAVSANSGALEQYEKLKKEFEEKKKFAANSGLQGGSRLSYYADRIAMDIPEAIQLTGMNLQPMEKKNSSGQDKISFKQKQVRITGSSASSLELNEWINTLKKKEFVEDVVLGNYTQEKEKRTGSFFVNVNLK